ncbi:MAG: alkane 1-monooxygenase [Paracoccus sp. (in: a-proteobacteria)]|uniref:alkane 1-monooxygenase n=1 Tax=Paracoccus sp. TaxID=267 RepID=UPI0026DFDD37|nr:alkane 1-monooxygenase [Paracoccus sp. (in: a-proteobacteria)]MDO5632682.1 alkane 1-monooxygenase [Paracoccus sp. (in: a-proteobacteria)]
MKQIRYVPPVAAFVAVGALPAVLILSGWVWAALILLAVAGPAADTLLARGFGQDEDARGADAGLVVLALCHLAVMAVAVLRLSGDDLGWPQRMALFLAAGMYAGQVGHAVGHELIHRGARGLFRLGAAVYVSMLFGHHVSAHRLVHHVHVATENDPNSARAGQGFWRFALRAWAGSFRTGLTAERALSARRTRRMNPYVWWVGGGLACMLVVAVLTGPRGLADYLGLSLYAQIQILLSDYVQHYGLRRRTLPDGRTEPVGPRHAWDSPHPISSLMLVNAPRHADHHMNPARPYPALRLPDNRPLLPYPIAIMAAIALIPPLWRRVMDRRVDRMQPP